MKNLLFISFIGILITSCGLIKKTHQETVTEHYIHDTTIVQSKESFTPVFVPIDSTKAYFDLKELLDRGELSSTDRQFVTRIIYRDGKLEVDTHMDSVMLLLRKYEQTLTSIKSESDRKTQVADEKKSKFNFNWLILAAIVVCVLVVSFGKPKLPKIQ